MPFLEDLLNNPQFQMGMGLLGTASPRNQPMAQAYQLLQARKMAEQQALQQQQEMKHKEAQMELAREQASNYRAQVEAQKRKLEKDEALQENVMKMLPQIFGGQQPQAPSQQPQMQPPQPALPPPVSGGFSHADKFVASIEGGFVPNDAGKGPTNYGINQRANPDIDVKTLNPEAASQVRKQRYWDAIKGDTLPPNTAAIAYDAAINQGQQYAQELLSKTGGDPALMLYQRKQDYAKLAKSNPMHASNLKGWNSRLDKLSDYIKAPQLPPAQASSPAQGELPAHKRIGMIGAMAQIAAGDTGAGLKALADASKPDYEAAKITQGAEQFGKTEERQREELKVKQDAETRQQAKLETEKAEAKAKAFKVTTNVNSYLDRMAETAKQLRDHKGLGMLTGTLGGLIPPRLLGEDARNANAILENLKGQVFTASTAALRQASESGASVGQQSDVEGQRLEASMARLNQAQSLKEFQSALDDLMKVAGESKKNLREAYKIGHGEELPAARRIVKTGKDKKTGRKVVQYDDGSVDYAD